VVSSEPYDGHEVTYIIIEKLRTRNVFLGKEGQL